MSFRINAQCLGATSDTPESVGATVAMDCCPVQPCINGSSLSSCRASAWSWLQPYFDPGSEDDPEQAMDAFLIASQDLGPAGRWIVEAVLRPLSDQIWKKIRHCDQYYRPRKKYRCSHSLN